MGHLWGMGLFQTSRNGTELRNSTKLMLNLLWLSSIHINEMQQEGGACSRVFFFSFLGLKPWALEA